MARANERRRASSSLYRYDDGPSRRTTSLVRRSAIREAEVAELLEEGHLRTGPLKRSFPERYDASNRDMEKINPKPPVTLKLVEDADASAWESPSVKAKAWREHVFAKVPEDPAEPLLSMQDQRSMAPSLNTSSRYSTLPSNFTRSVSVDALASDLSHIRLHQQPRHAEEKRREQNILSAQITTPQRYSLEERPSYPSHTLNLRMAIEQCRKLRYGWAASAATPTAELLQQLEYAAEAADSMNQELRFQLGRESATYARRSGFATASVPSIDVAGLLRQSDDQVRSITNAILLVLKELRTQAHPKQMSEVPMIPSHSLPYEATTDSTYPRTISSGSRYMAHEDTYPLRKYEESTGRPVSTWEADGVKDTLTIPTAHVPMHRKSPLTSTPHPYASLATASSPSLHPFYTKRSGSDPSSLLR
ncbi:hypothetical protein ACI68E_001947 [Malassezia pachydermatis]